MEAVMATPIQNQAQAGPPVNVLHDQNSPNTLGGIGPPAAAAGIHFTTGVFVTLAVLIAAVLVILVARLI
jgi:hypothetical protein